MNLICLNAECINNNIGCGLCMEELHFGHKIKPIKVILH